MHNKTQSDPPLIGFCHYWVYNIYMSPRHFSKVMHSPYFLSDHYKEESPGGILETKIENFFKKIFKKEKLEKKKQ